MSTVLVGAGAIVAAAAGLFGLAVVRRSRAIGGRVAAIRADVVEPLVDATSLAIARGTFLGTSILLPPALGGATSLEGPLDGAGGSISVDAGATVFATESGQFHVPHARVSEAALLSSASGRTASAHESLLRLTWERGGERLATSFAIQGRRIDAERLRREIHVRAGKAAPIPVMSSTTPEP